MTLARARSAAAARLWSDEGYPAREWAADVRAIHEALGRAGLQDPVIESAAHLAPLVARPAGSSLAQYLDGEQLDLERATQDAREIQ